MIVASRAVLVKSRLAELLATYMVDPVGREPAALDIIEFIAFRLRHRDDDMVFNLGLFVRDTLATVLAGNIGYNDAHTRLTASAMAARVGTVEFLRSVDIGVPAARPDRRL